MLRKIEAARKQPKHIRNRYAFWISLGVTSVIAVFWLSSVPSRFSTQEMTLQKYPMEGGVSRIFNQMRASVSETAENNIPSTTTEHNEEMDEKINFETFFSTSTPDGVSTTDRIKHAPKRVLIGTSSVKSKDSSGE